jgi:signal transduction histidine kinase
MCVYHVMKYIARNPIPVEFAEHVPRAERGQASRLAFVTLVGLLSLVALPLPFALGWIALVFVWDLDLGARINDQFSMRPGLTTAQIRGRVAMMSGWVGASLYGLLPFALALEGSPAALFIGLAWVAGTASHCFVYFSKERAFLISHLSPPILLFCAGLIISQPGSINLLVMILTVGTMVTSSSIFARDRNTLLESLDTEKAARQAADDANAAKTQFLATMSHELRTPLNAVIGYAEIMQEDIEDDRMPKAADTQRIRASAKHLLGLINEVLDISKLEADRVVLNPEPTDLPALFANVRDTLTPLAEKNANQLQLIVQPGIGHAQLDPQRLTQCLLNLGSNACKFTHNGRVMIVVDSLREDGVIMLRANVSDTGIGISEDAAQHLFTPFVQADGGITRKFGGTGLGLAITRRLARQMGGDVSFTSTPGKGTTFTLTIAAPPVEVATPVAIAPSAPQPRPATFAEPRRAGLGLH